MRDVFFVHFIVVIMLGGSGEKMATKIAPPDTGDGLSEGSCYAAAARLLLISQAPLRGMKRSVAKR